MTEPAPLADRGDAEVSQQFPGILRAALTMTLDNGGINRDRSEADMQKDLAAFLAKCMEANHSGIRTTLYSQLWAIDNWLNQLSEDELNTVCNGEETEAQDAIKTAPDGTNFLLNGIFDNVV
jgi:hypothetical protein